MTEFEAFTEDQLRIIRQELLPKETSAGEFDLFVQQCYRSQLDPFSRQIMGTPGYSKGSFKLTIVTTIDGFRLIADRTGKYDGQTEQEWCGADGAWRTVWLEDNPPAAARCGVYRKGTGHPSFAVMTWKESPGPGSRSPVWKSMPAHMLSKCAEALALRKAFPNDLSGLYTSDELPPDQPAARPNRETSDGHQESDIPEDESIQRAADTEVAYVPADAREGLLERVKAARAALEDEAFGVLRDGLIEDGALLDSGHMPVPLPAESYKAAERRLLVAATPAPAEPLKVDDSVGVEPWTRARLIAAMPDGWEYERLLETLLIKANLIRPDGNGGAGFESWGDLKKDTALVSHLMAAADAGTLESLTAEPFDA